ncbi:MAG: AAA family ATPase [Candidatus Thorarchaeota archaeon]
MIKNAESRWFIVISGPPASGKTTLGRKIARELYLPFYTKDDFKELIFDSLGWDDRNWSKGVGRASMNLLYLILEKNLAVGVPIVIETAFYREFESKRLTKIIKKFKAKPLQIYCYTNEKLLRRRFLERVVDGERHPGHGDISVAEKEYSKIDIFDTYGILEIPGILIKLDTSDFNQINFSSILDRIKRFCMK